MSNYSIWVCEYSWVTNYNKSAAVYGAHNQGYLKLPYCYVLIKGNNHIAMVNVGYNHKEYGNLLADKFGVENWRSPKVVLSELGIIPEDVDTCFITHAHFDHFRNVEDFSNAKFYIQEREIAKWVRAMSLPKRLSWMMVAVDPGDIVRGVELARDGRLVTVNGDMKDVLPGIDLRADDDTHTWGSMWVSVRNDSSESSDDKWILAGDVIYQFDNIEDIADNKGVYNPVGLAVGSQANLVMATEEMMKDVNYESRRIIPTHEERLKEVFPSRTTKEDLRITEICLADGERSRVIS
ncbi:Metallo-beta-lactamase [Bartonella apihabitans]|uniref:N-acyl homoserine lactonase family protein n=1 Tax=Bartonella apihabitans TaxID=2750929 RepID=UPI003997A17B